MTTEPKKSPVAVAAPEGAEPEATRAPGSRPASGLRHWLAVGTGVGIEIRDSDLQVVIARVRPASVSVSGSTRIADFRNRPAAEWGTELATFLRKNGAGHIAVTVLLPRREVIVRQVHLPGVADRDLPAAIQLQIDSLHPFADDDVCFSWARLSSSPVVMVGIIRREILDAYFTSFAEAGVKLASLTYSAAVLYSASRLLTVPPAGFVLAHESNGEVEVYGESEARAAWSATLPMAVDRALAVGRSELRLEPDAPVLEFSDLLPAPVQATAEVGLAYATALSGACPWLGIDGNLLPDERRRASSRVRLIPTFLLAGTLLVLIVLLALQSRWADARYLGILQHEIGKREPSARRADTIDKMITATRARSQRLDDFKRRAKLDMDALAEATRLLPPPGWVTTLDMDRNTVQIAGETDQAAELLQKFDGSPLFERSEFTTPISRASSGDMFRMRTQRQTPPPALRVPAPPAPVPAAAPNGGAK
jgi:hypothetical protein